MGAANAMATEATSINNDWSSSAIYSSSSDLVQRPLAQKIEATPRRHLVLLLFVLSAALNGVPFSHNFVGRAFVHYYNTTDDMVNILAYLFMAAFIVAAYPASWVFETQGLRFGVLLGLFFNAAGAWLFCASQSPSLFWVTLVAQGIIGLGQPFMLNIPPFLASVWFPAEEVSRACAIASFGQPVGVLGGVAVLPFILSGTDTETLYKQFLWYRVGYAIAITLILIASFIVIKDQPDNPPSKARAEIIRNPPKPVVYESIVKLLKNKNYIVHFSAFSLMNGTQNAFISVLNQLILKVFPHADGQLWIVGLILCVTGIVSVLCIGLILDKTHKYKETAIGLIIAGIISVSVWTGIFTRSLTTLFITVTFIGFFVIAYLPAGLDLGAEITYPVSEVTTTSILSVGGCVVGIALTYLCTWTLDTYGALSSNLTFIAFMAVALIITVFVKPDLRRLRTNTEAQTN